jgi:4-hydroxy 2-oxovalerate aldolase
VDRESRRQGYAGVYSSFLRDAETVQYGLDTCAILVAAGRRGMVHGQEDMITNARSLCRRNVSLGLAARGHAESQPLTAGGPLLVCGPCFPEHRLC